MNPDLAVGFGLAAIGAALLLFNAWMTYADRKANLIVQEALRKAAEQADEIPAETVDRMRHYVQAEAWVMERTPIADRLAEERFRRQLQDDGRPSWLP